MANVFVQDTTMSAIADAIRGKRGISDRMLPGEMAEQISKISTGGDSGDAGKPIRFYDYEGTLLHSFTFEELDQLEELPAFPTHDGLIGEGWNWSLEDLKGEGKETNVGPMFMTDNGATRFYMELDEFTLELAVNFFQTVSHGVKVDWGDGSPLESGSGISTTSTVCLKHAYAEPGEYVIQLIPQGDTQISFKAGTSTYGSSFFSTGSDYREDIPVMQSVRKIEMGSNIKKVDSYSFCRFYNLEGVTIPQYLSCSSGNGMFSMSQNLRFFVYPTSCTYVTNYAFTESYALEGVSLPKGVLSINTRAFTGCRSLKNITLPKGLYRLQEGCFNDCFSLEKIDTSYVTLIEKGVFQKCKVLKQMAVPKDMTYASESLFYDCYSMRKIVIPESVTSIERYCFANCAGLREMYLYPKTPPVFSSTGVFMGMGTKCKFYVPKGSLAAYQSADVIKTYADRMVEMDA